MSENKPIYAKKWYRSLNDKTIVTELRESTHADLSKRQVPF